MIRFLCAPSQVALTLKLPYMACLLAAYIICVFKYTRRPLFAVWALPCLAVYVVCNLFVPNIDGWVLPLNSTAMFAVLVISTVTCFDVSVKVALFGVINGALLQHISTQLKAVIIDLFAYGGMDISSAWQNALTYICCTVVCVAAYFLFGRKIDLKNIVIKTKKSIAVVGLVVLLVYVIWEIAVDEDFTHLFIYNLTALIACITLVALFSSFNSVDSMRIENEVTQRMLIEEQKHYSMLTENIEAINHKYHDLKYLALAKRSSPEYDESVKNYAELATNERVPCTGNIALDNMLNSKNLICEYRKIEFGYFINGALFDFMDAIDIYSLFGNAIDNAIECVSEYTDEKKRYISVRSAETAGFIGLHFENYCETAPKFDGDLPKTSKADSKNHGYGIKSMRYIVEKYGGTLTVSVRDNMFYLDILFLKKPDEAV